MHPVEPPPTDLTQTAPPDRAAWMRTLALADPAWLEDRWQALADPPGYTALRGPEIGLVMVRGRMSGTGDPFNLGEMTMTRCSVRLDSGAIGHGHIAGRQARHAELAAVFDALLQTPDWAGAIHHTVIDPANEADLGWRQAVAADAAKTRVDFVTLPRTRV